jgi:hypothetical protein
MSGDCARNSEPGRPLAPGILLPRRLTVKGATTGASLRGPSASLRADP